MDIVLVTGSAGLIGSEAVRFFAKKGLQVVGIDNDMRRVFFGDEASTSWNRARVQEEIPGYIHASEDIRDKEAMERLFSEYGNDIKLIIHTAAQPSHDWAARDPFTDFTVNANGTLVLLEMTRRYSSKAVFLFTSSNKVYGDTPNYLPLIELETRWEIDESHPYYTNGIDESMSIDQTRHSLFGVSKVASDVLVQEYGRYFGIYTACFRGGCLSGPSHSGTELHGFLAYLMKCAITGNHYTIFGYKGKQVRDTIHSYDLVNMFWHFYQKPKTAEVYNAGGGRHSNFSILEAIALCEEITGRKVNWSYTEKNRIGDHIWWISDIRKFQKHYPQWEYRYNLQDISESIYAGIVSRI
ncbi:MAG: NAD-dependent epimerase/dehydratase family protein [Desulfobacteraceae bacterium]|nr:NAD-dependent epimerase/dehydratase family protein [Desulfobacteraceae bacterium]